MVSNDPWKDLSPPSVAKAISAKRVDAGIPWDFFWARSFDGFCLLVVQHAEDSTPQGKLPHLQGIEVSETDGTDGVQRLLILKLLDSSQRDLFHRLCSDILSCAETAKSEKEMLGVVLSRTWRWHHLLRGGSDRRLSAEEQKGLIGELLVLERYLFPSCLPMEALSAWGGPMGSPKDFEMGQVGIEVKARRGGAAPFVVINSENQLDESSLSKLFLVVTDLDRAPVGSGVGFSLTEVAVRLKTEVERTDPGATEKFEALISASGFRWADDYSDISWLEGATRLFLVKSGFPRLIASQVPTGVSKVRYSLSLVDCHPFRVESNSLSAAIQGDDCDN